jgi:hypothetical protein
MAITSKLKLIASSLVSAALLVGCAFGADSDSNKEKEVEDRTALKQTYDVVRGTYRGTLKTSDRSYPISISLYTDEEKAGTNADGEIIFRPILRALYKRLDIVTADYIMDARYISLTGEIVLKNLASNTTNEDVQSINAALSGQIIRGTVNTKKGQLGTIELTLASREVEAPSQGDQNTINEKLRKQYEEIAGVYEGDVIPDPTLAPPFAIQVRLFVISQNGPNGPVPAVSGYYKRLDDISGGLDLALEVTYKPETIPAQLIMKSLASGRSAGPYYVSIEGILQDGSVLASVSTQRGYQGEVVLRKK